LRFGIADQQTLNASLMQACRSSAVSADALEAKKASASASAMGDAFVALRLIET